jgi:hypothetical protein
MHHTLINEARERAVYVFTICVKRFSKGGGGLRAVLEQVKVRLCLLFAEPETDQTAGELVVNGHLVSPRT